MRASELPPAAPAVTGNQPEPAEPDPQLAIAVADSAALPGRIGSYLVLGELGRGGMARVYRALDETSGRQFALKQLLKSGDGERQAHASALFEREYHTLAQLSHPSVIEVYDYGVADEGAYYTMELLDGGDLRRRAPLQWQQACELLYDVCSSLALLHSRRLVHRDITPRNVHCTAHGRAKLIDFGAMAPMGPGGKVVGTPAFVAPEVVHRSTLDGRADLYSLGATLYYTITGCMPYPARDLSGVLKAWLTPPAPPSLLVEGVPPALDALVMSMISLEPAMRPRGAFEVMQRLAAIAGIERVEPLSVSQAYLSAPLMIGRDQALAAFRGPLRRALRSRGGGLLVEAEAGLGRSRLLDAFALEAKLAGAVTLRAGANTGQSGPLSVARMLADQLIDALPDAALEAANDLKLIGSVFELRAELVIPGVTAAPRATRILLRDVENTPAARIDAQSKLSAWFRRVAAAHPMLIAVDDAERVDAHSVALLAAITQRARRSRALIVLSADPAARASNALDIVAPHCTKLELQALDLEQTEALLTSVFGDVPNIALLAHRIHTVAAGRPRECMTLAQHLVDRGVISYAGGSWTLPEQLSTNALPTRGSDVFRARITALDARARCLAQAQALLARGALTREDYALLDSQATSAQLDAALDELLRQAIIQVDGASYRLSHAALRDALQSSTEPSARKALHLTLAELCVRSDRPAIHAASHLFEAGSPERALDRLMESLNGAAEAAELERQTGLPFGEIARLMERALDASEELPRPPRERYELRRWLLAIAIVDEDRLHRRAAPVMLAQLEYDSGLEIYRQIIDEPDPMKRLMRALQSTQERATQTPEEERVYTIQDAIKNLVYYVVTSIAIGARTFDVPLLASLPELLEPFAPLSPAVHAMWQNALATLEVNQRKTERARARWIALYEKLENITNEQLASVDVIRAAIAFAIGSVEAHMGLDSVGRWAEVLDQDLLQRVNAMYLRKALCMQRGDFEAAERFRRKAEVLAIQASSRQMFTQTMTVELGIHALARDLTGVKQIMDRIEPIAAHEPRWLQYQHLAVAQFHRLRGDLDAARAACERGLAVAAPDANDPGRSYLAWPSIVAAYIETLIELGRAAEARLFGERALETCTQLGIEAGAFDVVRALAQAEGKCGELTKAADRLELLIAAQRKLGVVGLNLGASYEARARIGIWAGDHAGVEHYARLTALEYRHGRSSPLGTRYERLLQEARLAGVHALPQLSALDAGPIGTTTLGGRRSTIETSVTEALKAADTPRARAELALGLLCEAHAARGGHLYLMSDNGLSLSASLSSDAPDEHLHAVLYELCQQQLDAPDMPTTFAQDAVPPAASSTNMWTDARGTAYQPLPITCAVDGKSMLVGVAALLPGRDPQPRSDAAYVIAIVGSYLMRAGDARAVAC